MGNDAEATDGAAAILSQMVDESCPVSPMVGPPCRWALVTVTQLERTEDTLPAKYRSRLAMLANPMSDKFLPRQKGFFSSLQTLQLARVST